VPPYGPAGRNPFTPEPRRRRLPAWVAGGLLPALVGGVVALGGAAVTGNLGGGDTTVVAGDPSPLPASVRAPSRSVASDGPTARTAGAPTIQAVVAESSPAVVKVTVAPGGAAAGADSLGGRLGSGFLVDRRGRVLTNAHVIDDADVATVTFDDGTETEARVLGTDESTDLAVLLVTDLPSGVAPLPLGRSADLVVGDPVIAIGNPFGLERTATTGIVSALKRIITAPNGFEIQNVIQTDAAINTGNSGGPLLDRDGRVLGINSQIATESGGSNGIGFAVPIDTIRPVADSIIADGRAQHAWLGVTGRSVTPAIADALGIGEVRGVVVIEVDERGPAREAGLKAATTPRDADVPRGGDLIVAVDGRAVEDMADVSRAVSSRAVGGTLPLTVLRDGRRVDLRIALEDRPDDVGVVPAAP
jgi:S1-C subfamily serine protease